MNGVCNSRILRVAAIALLAAGWCDARAGAVFEQLSVSLTIVDSCTISALDREVASDAPRGRASGPVHVACSGGAAPSVTFARVPRAIAFAGAGIAPPAGEGAFEVERSAVAGADIVRATVTF
ncbi:MAG TPA: hypothetical protein VFS55_00855 [Dokdonella sp.]|nr:hypothetical protein [Dokdonella sp.]